MNLNISKVLRSLCLFLLLSPFSQGASIESEVDAILAHDYSLYSTQVTLLARLGSPAVPVLCSKLGEVKHPCIIIDALGKLKNRGATCALLDLLSARQPLFPEENSLNLIIIDALKEIGDERAQEMMSNIMASDSAHAATRLAAARALARLGTSDIKRQARQFIERAYVDVTDKTLDKVMLAEVDAVLSRGQNYGGQATDRLVDLGVAAVPAMCSRLTADKFPMTIIHALARLKDRGATESLIAFLQSREPLSPEDNVEADAAIEALMEIGDQRAETKMLEIMLNESADLCTRLYAAAALARFASPELKNQAGKFTMAVYAEPLKYHHPIDWHEWFPTEELLIALCEVGTDEALTAVLAPLESNTARYPEGFHMLSRIFIAIFEHLPCKKNDLIRRTLLSVCADETQEPHVRVKALDVLLRCDDEIPLSDLKSRFDCIAHFKFDYYLEYQDMLDSIRSRLLERERENGTKP